MMVDFDEDTLETITSEVIGPIAEMRRQKAIKENTFTISRENYEASSDEQVEAWFTKFDDVIIDDSKNPYKDPLTKKEIVFKVLDMVSIENINKGITKFNSGINQFSKMVEAPKGQKKKSISFGISQKDYDSLFKSPKRKGNSTNFWNEDKKTRSKRNKKRSEPKTKQISFYGSKKVKFF